jgi:hypothetical protein
VGGDDLPADLLPHRLGVDEDPVQVEHDRLDQRRLLEETPRARSG